MTSSDPLLIALLSALVGACAAGAVQAILRAVERAKEVEAIRAALIMEVVEICRLMRFRQYASTTAALLEQLQNDPDMTGAMIADLREDYFSVFHALGPQLGRLKADEAAKVVEFYMLCKSAKDSIAPDGIMVDNDSNELAVQNAEQLLELMQKALRVGDELAQLLSASSTPLIAE